MKNLFELTNLDSTRKFLAFRSNKRSFYIILENSEKMRLEAVKGSCHVNIPRKNGPKVPNLI